MSIEFDDFTAGRSKVYDLSSQPPSLAVRLFRWYSDSGCTVLNALSTRLDDASLVRYASTVSGPKPSLYTGVDMNVDCFDLLETLIKVPFVSDSSEG